MHCAISKSLQALRQNLRGNRFESPRFSCEFQSRLSLRSLGDRAFLSIFDSWIFCEAKLLLSYNIGCCFPRGWNRSMEALKLFAKDGFSHTYFLEVFCWRASACWTVRLVFVELSVDVPGSFIYEGIIFETFLKERYLLSFYFLDFILRIQFHFANDRC